MKNIFQVFSLIYVKFLTLLITPSCFQISKNGFSRAFRHLMRSYPANWKQFVPMMEQKSRIKKFEQGVLKCSILGFTFQFVFWHCVSWSRLWMRYHTICWWLFHNLVLFHNLQKVLKQMINLLCIQQTSCSEKLEFCWISICILPICWKCISKNWMKIRVKILIRAQWVKLPESLGHIQILYRRQKSHVHPLDVDPL